MRVDELRRTLTGEADRVEEVGVHARLSAVDQRIAVSRRRRRAATVVALGFACVAVLGVVAVVPSLVPDGAGPQLVTPTRGATSTAAPPPPLAGYALPRVVRANDVGYEYFRSEESTPGPEPLRVVVTPSSQPQALLWVSPPGLTGQIVVTVDGDIVARNRAGSLQSGVLLSAGRKHLVVLRASRPNISMRLGVAVYRWPRP